MGKRLSEAEVAAFERDGAIFPLRAYAEPEIAGLRQRLEDLARREGGKLSRGTNQKPHMLFPWLAETVRRPEILDPVEDILGPDILCWASSFFWKPAGDPGFVSWHQDSTYWGLSHPNVVTAWVAFTPSTPESGCMRVVLGTHRGEQVAHRDTFASENMLSRGQEIAVDVDEKRGGRHRPAAGRDVDPPRPPLPRLERQPGRPSAHRLRHPLHPHLCPPDLRDP